MSQANVEVARRFVPESVDWVALLADPGALELARRAVEPMVRSDAETVTVPGQVPLEGGGSEDPSQPTYRGIDGFLSAFGDWLSAWESWVVTPSDFIDVDEERVLVLLEVRARSKTHQVEIPIEAANLLTLRDGKVARMELFFDRAQAHEAAGLSD
jgi:hypothetical protein